jgi:hypothetical protein
LSYAFEAKNIKEYYFEYEKMMKKWNKVCKEKIYRINYEEITNNFDTTIKDLFDWLDLEFTNDTINFYKNDNNVKTTSKIQVRNPLYTKSNEKWMNYKEHLPELFE